MKTPWHHKSLSDKQTELSKSNEIPEKDIQIWKLHQIAAKPPFSIAVAGSAACEFQKEDGMLHLLGSDSSLPPVFADFWRKLGVAEHIWAIYGL